MPHTLPRATLSVAIITFNEEENIGRTLASVKDIADEIIIVDSHSTDRTVEIAKQFGAKVFIEAWKGFAAQKNSALDKCTCDWILSLDADEEVGSGLAKVIDILLRKAIALNYKDVAAFGLERVNYVLGKPLSYGGQGELKTRLVMRGKGKFKNVRVHEDLEIDGKVENALDYGFDGFREMYLKHYSYPTLTAYIEHMNRYSSLGAEMVVDKHGRVGFSVLNIAIRPVATFIYNYFFRLGFLDGKEGLLLHLYHSAYVSWKYAKAWELSRKNIKQ
jgi:glycosyltransferase involved in cell wall biosynthesis